MTTTRKKGLAKFVSILVVLGMMFNMTNYQSGVAYAEGEKAALSFQSATYRDETIGFEFDYPAAWTASESVALEGGETQVQFAAPEGTTTSLIVHRWEPVNDLDAYIRYRTEAWLAGGMTILSQDPMTLAGDRVGGRFMVQTTASEQTFFFFTSFGDRYIELNSLGDSALLTEIVSTVRAIETSVAPTETSVAPTETPVAPTETPAPPIDTPTLAPTATADVRPEAGLVIPAGEVIPDRYIVVYKAGVATASAAAADTSVIESLGGEVSFIYSAALQGYSAYLPAKALAEVRRNPLVDYVEADGWAYLDDDEVGVESVQASATWGLDRIDQRNLPLSTTYTYNTTASNVNVYIIDTGILPTHTQFGGRATADANFVSDGHTLDCAGHGTHVAGTIAGSTYGVAKGARIHAVRVFGCSGGSPWSTIIAGVDWVTAHHVHPAVVNMSLGGGLNTSLDTAIQTAINHGVTFVVSAGNDNANACSYSPAHLAAAITVGATTNTDARSYFSNWGTCLDVFAPGSDIKSAWYTSTTATNIISGTSMASPHVAGVAALYLATHTTALPATVASAVISNATTGKVTNPGTGSPNRLLYSLWAAGNPLPTLNAIAPYGAGTGGPGFFMMVSGANFIPTSKVYFSSTPLNTTYVSATQLKALVPAVLIATAGNRIVRVYNPAPGGGWSLSKPFTVKTPKQWTFMVYLDGDNNLEADAVDDFLEMASVGSSSDVNIIVQFDRRPSYDTRYGDWTTTKRFYITPGMTPDAANALSDLGELNQGNPNTLQSFVNWAESTYPANKYAVILWNHGGGFQPTSEEVSTEGVSWDDTNGGDYLSNIELSNVLASVTSGGLNKLEMVGFDACLMAMVEVDQHIKNYANSRVSSETTEPGAGWPYNTIMADLTTYPSWNGITLANDIATRYYQSYGNGQTQSSVQYGAGYNAMVTTYLNTFAQALRTNMATQRSVIAAARTASQSFAYPDNIDLADFAQQVYNRSTNAAVKSAAINLHNAVVGVVKNNKAGASWPRAHGTAIFFPQTEAVWGAWAASYQTNQWLARDTYWNEFLNEYYGTTMTITLTWGASPNDLDSHLWLPAATPFHVRFNSKGSLTAFPFALLDVDDTSSYGPENISIKQFKPGLYLYDVYNWSGNTYNTLKASGAVVRVYRNSALVKTYYASTAGGVSTDRWWKVFWYNPTTNVFTTLNTLSSVPGSSYQASPSDENGEVQKK